MTVLRFKRTSGILLHVTSLPSAFGIGDFGRQSYKFIDFLNESGQTFWQILPLCPTGVGDSPYQSPSSFAGNPLLISPEEMVSEGLLSFSELNPPAFNEHKTEYKKVIEYKSGLFAAAYEKFKNKNDETFSAFLNENDWWLSDYAELCALKEFFTQKRQNDRDGFLAYALENKGKFSEIAGMEYYFGAVWNSFPENLDVREPESLEKWRYKLSDRIGYFKFLQFEFFRQWKRIKNYAKDRGIKIIGDMPIFAAYDSADVWVNKKLFSLDENNLPVEISGVPPDYFSKTGQLWGNPLYNWKAMKETGYDFWIKRISQAFKMYDVLRIDHFRAFAAYWAVPYGERTAENGRWLPGPGEEFFKHIEKALGKLPIIAEDLGIITPDVTELRKKFDFPGMKVLQFAFDGSDNNPHLPHNFLSDTVVYTGTHDNNTTIGWYSLAGEREKDLFRRYMNTDAKNPGWDLIRLAAASTAQIAIYPLQDVLSLGSEARMNRPGESFGNWQFRYKEDMLTSDRRLGLLYLTKLFERLR